MAPSDRPPLTQARPKQERDLIAENLRTLFDETAREALPDRFKDLLRRMAEEERK